MMSAVGMKKKSAATVQMVSDDGPDWRQSRSSADEDGGDVEEQDVPKVQLPAKLGLNFCAGGVDKAMSPQ